MQDEKKELTKTADPLIVKGSAITNSDVVHIATAETATGLRRGGTGRMAEILATIRRACLPPVACCPKSIPRIKPPQEQSTNPPAGTFFLFRGAGSCEGRFQSNMTFPPSVRDFLIPVFLTARMRSMDAKSIEKMLYPIH